MKRLILFYGSLLSGKKIATMFRKTHGVNVSEMYIFMNFTGTGNYEM